MPSANRDVVSMFKSGVDNLSTPDASRFASALVETSPTDLEITSYIINRFINAIRYIDSLLKSREINKGSFRGRPSKRVIAASYAKNEIIPDEMEKFIRTQLGIQEG